MSGRCNILPDTAFSLQLPLFKNMQTIMKKLLLSILVLAAAASPVFAQFQEAYPSYIQVNGRAEMEVVPDEFYLSIVINERESKGKISVESQQREMIAALKRLGIDTDRQLKMANLSNEFFKRGSGVATAKYQLQVGSAGEVAQVCAALDAIGIVNVGMLRVTHSKIDEYKQQVRLGAIRDARRAAAEMAGAIDQRIGKCFYIYDSNSDVMPRLYDNTVVMRAKATGYAEDALEELAEETPEFKTIKLQYNVQAKFVLE